LYDEAVKRIKVNSSGQGEIPDRRYSPRLVDDVTYLSMIDLVKFQNRQYSLDVRRKAEYNADDSP
jgi:hypothetical protein